MAARSLQRHVTPLWTWLWHRGRPGHPRSASETGEPRPRPHLWRPAPKKWAKSATPPCFVYVWHLTRSILTEIFDFAAVAKLIALHGKAAEANEALEAKTTTNIFESLFQRRQTQANETRRGTNLVDFRERVPRARVFPLCSERYFQGRKFSSKMSCDKQKATYFAFACLKLTNNNWNEFSWQYFLRFEVFWAFFRSSVGDWLEVGLAESLMELKVSFLRQNTLFNNKTFTDFYNYNTKCNIIPVKVMFYWFLLYVLSTFASK